MRPAAACVVVGAGDAGVGVGVGVDVGRYAAVDWNFTMVGS